MTAWELSFEGFDPDDEGRREALCVVGNGYFATRGAAPESVADGVHYPGTYVAGCYNRLTSRVADHDIEDESLVNMPNWLLLTFRIDDGPWFTLDSVELLSADQELDIERGILLRRLRFRDAQRRTTRLVQRRFVHLGSPHLAGLETTLVPEDWSGRITFRSGIDGRVTNTGVARYRALDGRHLVEQGTREITPTTVLLHARTSQSGIVVAEACRSEIWLDTAKAQPRRTLVREENLVAHDLEVTVRQGQRVRLEKIVALHTSRDLASTEPIAEAEASTREAAGFEDLLATHALAWTQVWARYRCGLSTDVRARRAVNLNLLHLLQTVSTHTADLDVGIPARGLHGEAYRGHIFWDELFVLPTITLRTPHLTRSLLLYRYRRLPQARAAARREGFAGAMYPWQSGSNGREESQRIHLNPESGRWLPDNTHLQRHIGIAIAYNVWHYYQATGDEEFLGSYGAEMILEITRFFASLATYDHGRDRYVIHGVVGPDEYHTAYPDTDRAGIDNHAYTNIMTAWLCRVAADAVRSLPADRRSELIEQLRLDHREFDRWRRMTRKLFVPFHDDGVISQYEGYNHLAELDWDDYRRRYPDIRRLDRILEAEGRDPNEFQASKQADVLMLFYLLSAEELRAVLHDLGYEFSGEQIPKNIDYYLHRTSHGSTLSAVVHAWVLARGHRARAVEFFDRALVADLDSRDGTTREGIHLAGMVGGVDLLQRCFAGIEVRGGALRFDPHWPTELGVLELSIRYHAQPVLVRVSGRTVTVRTAPGPQRPPIRCVCGSQSVLLGPGETAHFATDRPAEQQQTPPAAPADEL
ncbi:glycoside hydrolase family 65 protein [Actinoalloteichus hymeniacidonis]|uniref:Trehalose/maltose hydrolase or phosphorylase n=1 Tax=Actinoalloteichus hymeniacidonis TaxID=340345 RepID=A0AAC9HRS8_9PSEU|nr:glycosyl hydrolase family 65 protein [Actinoalloteichus hymeniacidonis]AOS64233.1 trehalose/maltose hydrolase or phosphorylase [Actinoalloteichus hymeniacidonis]MBB5907699.1 trehalose 6-phosphate phosphatase [Actinoalloteichus hymeniacidonis]